MMSVRTIKNMSWYHLRQCCTDIKKCLSCFQKHLTIEVIVSTNRRKFSERAQDVLNTVYLSINRSTLCSKALLKVVKDSQSVQRVSKVSLRELMRAIMRAIK